MHTTLTTKRGEDRVEAQARSMLRDPAFRARMAAKYPPGRPINGKPIAELTDAELTEVRRQCDAALKAARR